ncbi:MAG: hypothetical protein AAB316_04740 [Bacteroidota bacterium]
MKDASQNFLFAPDAPRSSSNGDAHTSISANLELLKNAWRNVSVQAIREGFDRLSADLEAVRGGNQAALRQSWQSNVAPLLPGEPCRWVKQTFFEERLRYLDCISGKNSTPGWFVQACVGEVECQLQTAKSQFEKITIWLQLHT